jgi:hypothetical protein
MKDSTAGSPMIYSQQRLRARCLLVLLAVFGADATLRAAADSVPPFGWQSVTTHAKFAGRDGAGLLAFNNKLWLLGGWNSSSAVFPLTTTNEVWNSSDGVNWRQVKPNTFGTAAFNQNADWAGRHMAGWVVFKNKIWIVGGDSNQCQYEPDIWNSGDGVTWNLVTAAAPWGNRVLFYTVVFNNKIWVMGGQTLVLSDCANYPQPETFYNDIWSSPDGASWTQVMPDGAIWSPRGVICGAVVFNGRMWVIGGGTYGTPQHLYNDVWSSTDGVHWTRVAAKTPWVPRIYHSITAYNGRIWVIAGDAGNGNGDLQDSWSSVDGVTWTQVLDVPWLARHAQSVAVFNGAMWMTGGTTNYNGSMNDVWKLEQAQAIVPIISSELLQN